MTSIGSLSVDLALESSSFLTNLKKAAEGADKTAHQIESAMELAKGATEAFFGAMAADRFAEMIDSSVEYGAKMIDLSNKTGASTKSIQEFTFAMKQNGATSEEAETALTKFSKSLGQAQNGNQQMAKTLQSLGVTSFNNYDQALDQAMEGLGKLPSATLKSADATQLFGRSAATVAALAKGGAEGYKELADEAEKYGIVIDREILQKGKEAEDKISALKQVLAADISGAVLQNADAIAHMADEVIKLVSLLPQAMNALTAFQGQVAISRMNNGSFFNAGIAYDGHGGVKWQSGADSDRADTQFLMGSHVNRDQLYHEYKRKHDDALASGDRATADEYFKKANAVAAYDKGQRGGGEKAPPIINDAPPLKSKKSKEADDGTDAFLKQQEQYNRQILEGKKSLAESAPSRFKIEMELIDQEQADKNQEIDNNKKWSDAQKTVLKGKVQEETDIKRAQAIREEQIALDSETYDIAIQNRNLKIDELRSQEATAKTAAERRQVELAILDLEYKNKNDADQKIIDTSHDQAQIDAAMRDQNHLGVQKAADTKGILHSTMNPLQAWADAIPHTAAQMKETFQSIEVDGINKLTDDLMGVVDGTKSIGSAFADMTKSILADLAKLAIEKAIVGILGNVFHLNLGSVGARANGGYTPAGSYLVGERGPELVHIGANANVSTAASLQGAASGGGGASITFAPGSIVSNDAAFVQRATYEAIAQATPLITKQATDATLKQIRRSQT